MRIRPSELSLVTFAFVLGCVGVACARDAVPPLSVVTAESGPGRVLYLTYCESCHGAGGAGDGPVAAMLSTPPADLTKLWERYGTPLDGGRLAEHIDGRGMLFMHSREMPVWGREFFKDADPEGPNIEALKEHLIDVLIQYLEGLQTKQRT
jgi:mono/diheme cytochrome c family protein